MFTLRLVARPDARMVEVPLEIEAELPREFEGSAVLAANGLPRKVKIRSPKDALKLSTAYRIDQLAADVVKSALRGTPEDVAMVQDAVVKFIRNVRERRPEGAAFLVSSDGQGKIGAREQPGDGRAADTDAAGSDSLASLVKRIGEVEAGLVARVAQLEALVAATQKQMARTMAVSEVAGPGMEKMIGRPAAPASPRRATVVDAYAEGLRNELRSRIAAALALTRAEVERRDVAAKSAAHSEAQGASNEGASQRLRAEAATTAARQTALQRMAEEIDLYPAGELPLAAQLLPRLEAGLRDGPVATASASPAPDVSPPGPMAPFGRVADDDPVKAEEAAAAAVAASGIPKIVPDDPARTDEALAAEIALAVETEVIAGWQHLPSRPAAFDEPQGPDEVVGTGKRE